VAYTARAFEKSNLHSISLVCYIFLLDASKHKLFIAATNIFSFENSEKVLKYFDA